MDAHERGKTMPHPTSVDARPTGYLPLTAALSALLTSGGMLHGAADAQVVVDNSLESAWTTAAEWTLEEDLRIGGPPGGYLTMVVAVAADSRDNIYILDYVTQEIHVFDPEGGFLRTLGGQGDLEFTQQMADMPSLGMRRPVHFGLDLRALTFRIPSSSTPVWCTQPRTTSCSRARTTRAPRT